MQQTMKLSELAKQITDYIAENGDVEVKVSDTDFFDKACLRDPELDVRRTACEIRIIEL